MRDGWRAWLLVAISLLVLVGCRTAADDNTDTTPTLAPTASPTSLFAVGVFAGPRLNSAPESTIGDCSLDPNATGCGVRTVVEVDDALPLPLEVTYWEGIAIGVPEGFETLDFNEQLIIETTDTEAHPGNFTLIFSRQTAEEIDKALTDFADLENDRTVITNGLGEGYTRLIGNRGIVGVWPLESEQFLFVRASVSPGYWPAYAATMSEIAATLRLADN